MFAENEILNFDPRAGNAVMVLFISKDLISNFFILACCPVLLGEHKSTVQTYW